MIGVFYNNIKKSIFLSTIIGLCAPAISTKLEASWFSDWFSSSSTQKPLTVQKPLLPPLRDDKGKISREPVGLEVFLDDADEYRKKHDAVYSSKNIVWGPYTDKTSFLAKERLENERLENERLENEQTFSKDEIFQKNYALFCEFESNLEELYKLLEKSLRQEGRDPLLADSLIEYSLKVNYEKKINNLVGTDSALGKVRDAFSASCDRLYEHNKGIYRVEMFDPLLGDNDKKVEKIFIRLFHKLSYYKYCFLSVSKEPLRKDLVMIYDKLCSEALRMYIHTEEKIRYNTCKKSPFIISTHDKDLREYQIAKTHKLERSLISTNVKSYADQHERIKKRLNICVQEHKKSIKDHKKDSDQFWSVFYQEFKYYINNDLKNKDEDSEIPGMVAEVEAQVGSQDRWKLFSALFDCVKKRSLGYELQEYLKEFLYTPFCGESQDQVKKKIDKGCKQMRDSYREESDDPGYYDELEVMLDTVYERTQKIIEDQEILDGFIEI